MPYIESELEFNQYYQNIINRYVPTTFLGIIFVLATIIIAQRNLKK